MKIIIPYTECMYFWTSFFYQLSLFLSFLFYSFFLHLFTIFLIVSFVSFWIHLLLCSYSLFTICALCSSIFAHTFSFFILLEHFYVKLSYQETIFFVVFLFCLFVFFFSVIFLSSSFIEGLIFFSQQRYHYSICYFNVPFSFCNETSFSLKFYIYVAIFSLSKFLTYILFSI